VDRDGSTTHRWVSAALFSLTKVLIVITPSFAKSSFHQDASSRCHAAAVCVVSYSREPEGLDGWWIRSR
jgi:hypothetical protein